jgi:hypothetical protein
MILKSKLSIADNYQFTDQQKNELYNALNCSDENKQKRQLPYKRLLYFLSKTFVEEFFLYSRILNDLFIFSP